MTNRSVFGLLLLVGIAWLGTACRSQHRGDVNPTERPPAIATAPNMIEFVNAEKGIRFSYPAQLHPVEPPDEDFIIWLVPVPPHDARVALSVSVEVPKLPPHVPGFIPLGMVVRGYIDDLRKRHREITVDEPVSVKVDGANARHVRASWDDPDGSSHFEEAILTVHDDRVYIFRGNERIEELERVTPLLEQVVHSVRWE